MNPLVKKLEAFGPLPEDDKRFLGSLVRTPRSVGARVDLIREGDPPSDVRLILEGFACRYKLIDDGRRHIMAYLIPGDFCDLNNFLLKQMDHTIATLSPCKVVDLPRATVLEMTERPAIARAMLWATLVDEATLREWLVNIGARSAEQRVAHLLCELQLRLRVVGLAADGAYELPITQAELADTMGLSNVHVNRVLQRLRTEEMITFKGGLLVVLDAERLKAFGGFDPNYLHLDQKNDQTNGAH